MNNLVVMLIDKSGSMNDYAWDDNTQDTARDEQGNYLRKRGAVIEGFNRFLSLQQMRRDDCQMLLGYFDGAYHEIAWCPLSEMGPMSEATYHTGGGTEMYQAIETCILDIDKRLNALPANEQPGTVIMVVQSDGETAKNQEEAQAQQWLINEMKKRANWQFAFMACDDKAIRSASQTWNPDMIMKYQGADAAAFERVGDAILESVVTGRMGSFSVGEVRDA